MATKNEVIAGDYEGKQITSTLGIVTIVTGLFKTIELDKTTVKEYEIMDEESKKSATSAVGRAFVGGAILGPAGLLAGLSAKSKRTHVIAIEFKDGKRSLIQLNQKVYDAFMKKMF